MLAEFESERSHHQKLVKDYGRLVQRFENLQGDMQLLSPTQPGHHRSLSGISNISIESESSTSTERTDATGGKPEGEEDVCIRAACFLALLLYWHFEIEYLSEEIRSRTIYRYRNNTEKLKKSLSCLIYVE